MDSLPSIPIFGTIGGAIRMLRADWRPLLKILLIPTLVAAAIMAIVPNDFAGDDKRIIHNLLIFGINFMLQPWLMVAGLRFLVLNEQPRNWWPYYEPRWWRYLWKSIFIGFVLAAPVMVLGAILMALLPGLAAIVIILGLVLLSTFVSGRIVLALPASAIDNNDDLHSAWDKTRGNAMRILTIKFLAQILLLVPYLLCLALSFLISYISPMLGKYLTLWLVMLAQTLVLLPVNALLYGYFYRGMIVKQTSRESHVE